MDSEQSVRPVGLHGVVPYGAIGVGFSMLDSEEEKALEPFLDDQGRLKLWPARARPRYIALWYLASKVDLGRVYSERELNELLVRHHTFGDPALLRRELYIKRLLDREPDGSRYWRPLV